MKTDSRMVLVIGGGPSGLMAAEVLLAAGFRVSLYDAMPSLGRKFLIAGRGGLNITHAEDLELFISRYGKSSPHLEPLLRRFPPESIRAWMQGLGVESYVGSSGRVFPREMKAAPLLRAWLQRLRRAGLAVHARMRWQGWDEEGQYCFMAPDGQLEVPAAACVLALGGGSWPQLGSDGAWVPLLKQQGIGVAPLRPANCGFDVGWSDFFRHRFSGQPLKSVAASYSDGEGKTCRRLSECVVTDHGLEGSLIYVFAACLRDEIERSGTATLMLDLLPDHAAEQVQRELLRPRGSRSLSSHLRSRLGFGGVKLALVQEVLGRDGMGDMNVLAGAIKALPIRFQAPRPLAEAISSAGGVGFDELDAHLMLRLRPGVFCCGEMLDWEAPTGGYLLSGCLATGLAAGQGARDWLLQGGMVASCHLPGGRG